MNKNLLTSAAKFSLILALGFSCNARAEVVLPVANKLDSGVFTEITSTVNNNDTLKINHNGSTNQTFNNTWQSFDVPSNKYADFYFSNSGQISVNKIIGGNSSQIFGNITQSGAGGTVYLINSSGVLFGKDSIVNLNGFVVSAYDITNPDATDKNIVFGGESSGSIITQGNINIKEGGFAAILAPYIQNTGTINAQRGTIALISGKNITFNTPEGYQISLHTDKSEISNQNFQEKTVQVENTGSIKANGGLVFIQADKANELINQVVNNDGIIEADSLKMENGEICFGTVDINAENGILTSNGQIKANGEQAGNIKISASFAGLAGDITASGSKGGNISINSQGLSLAGNIKATGSSGDGGNVNINTKGKSWEISSSAIDVSGSKGGNISNTAGEQISTSGKYIATGTSGNGGNIDITAPALKFLSSEIDASGFSGGGKIQLGGEYQGGKYLSTDVIPNAQTLAMTSGTNVKANTTGENGDGGTIISWADERSAVLGNFSAKQGSLSGKGGLIEVSCGTNNMIFRAIGDAGIGGTFLYDPENITIADITFSEYPIIMGYNYQPKGLNITSTQGQPNFGYAISLDGNKLAVGSNMNDGYLNLKGDSGAVYLYSFTDSIFSGGILEGIIGSGYIGGKNINQDIEIGDRFGTSLSLDGNRLAIGAFQDDGYLNTKGDSGAVYLYSFADNVFSGGNLEGIIGNGYTGGKNINIALDSSDYLGSGVSLNGNNIAVGAMYDDGYLNSKSDSGAVYVFSFTDNLFSGGYRQSTIGHNYTGGKNISQTLDSSDYFGSSVSLYAANLAIGAYADDGYLNARSDSGAVYLYSFSDNVFSGGTLQSTIGYNYTGGKNINQALDNTDYFGRNVSLEDTELAVGAYADDGYLNAKTDSGAVYLFSFADNIFSGGALQSTIGYNYCGGKNINMNTENYDNFGYSVSLDSTRLAVGAITDDGAGNTNSNIGTVYLYSFTDSAFNGGTLQSIIGSGYTGGKNINNTTLNNSDYFGSSVALNSNRLAVGAYYDDGLANSVSNSGAVYLYSFDDSAFSGGTLQGIIGNGYTGGKNINQTLEANDYFGSSVALNGNRLAVGAYGDDGAANARSASGAVYLYSFTDSLFSGGNRESTIGYNYTDGKNVNNSALEANDYFGYSVALDGNRLAAGAYGDDGAANARSASGAVYLYSFTDSLFSGGNRESTIGYNYTGGKNVNNSALEVSDYFGYSISLNGNQLAAGASYDDGADNSMTNAGAVYLYSFTDSLFSGANNESIIGYGYTGGKNVNQALNTSDYFGCSVSLDSNRLAIGASYDDGFNNINSDSGAVYLYSFSDSLFSGINLESIIGDNYSGGKNINESINSIDIFGYSVALNGNRLAVGAINDDGFNNLKGDSGIVYLYSFTDNLFSGANLEGIIGNGFTGGKNINQTLDSNDNFGYSLSLNGNRLAVGAINDDGLNNSRINSGAIYLYSFTDNLFSGGNLEGTIGYGYTGGKNINISTLDTWDYLGSAVSLDENRLAAGAYGDDGYLNSRTDSGAVYLYSFADSTFSNGTYQANIGYNYSGGKNINLNANPILDTYDYFGRAVSLSGNGLAVGAYGDDGSGNLVSSSGAVHLFSFTDSLFNGGTAQAIIGNGYTGGKNINQILESNDYFGYSVSLDGTILAIGAMNDDGVGNSKSDIGAVYLYSFLDSSFSGGVIEGIIGNNYSGGKNINQILDNYDYFATSISLNENRLAVGATYDDGFNNFNSDCGAIYLYSFTDGLFSNGSLKGIMGNGYSGVKNIGQALEDSPFNDGFGYSVSIDGDRLAVGAYTDDGFNNSKLDSGAVYLYSFTDSSFSGGTLQSIIGFGYTGGKNINQTLDMGDNFGSSVSLDGNRLAIGAFGDDGVNTSSTNTGAIYLYSFTDSLFSGGNIQAILGKGYTGGKNININLDTNDNFGAAVSLDGTNIAVGAMYDDGYLNSKTDSGTIYLYSFADSLFSGGTYQANIGYNYVGGKNINLNPTLETSDYFGKAVSLDGTRLAVGAIFDDSSNNSIINSGAAYLYTFTDTAFNGGTHQATIGNGYTGGKNINQTLENNDYFGYSISISGNNLAIGAYADDGYNNSAGNSGAVYLYSFTDNVFTGGVLQSTIGNGYTGGKNINQALGGNDYFGRSLSLDGIRLAVGADCDDGNGNIKTDTGTVYLYTFSDSLFSGGTLQANIGNGYTGGKNINQILDGGNGYDYFGTSVALDGNRLAVGAYFDDGFNNSVMNSGVVYLYSFSDKTFNGGTLQGIVGNGYTGGKNINQSLDTNDYFGFSVALNGNQLAVGAYGDDGSANARSDSGAVYLYSFADSLFSDGNLESIIGYNYSGGKNINQSLDASDNFGYSIALNSNRLAVGAFGDDGSANARGNSGAVYLYSFTDNLFSEGNREATIGYNYSGGKNVNNSSLEANDYFGSAVSLDENSLAIGAYGDDGSANAKSNSGAAYLYSFTDSAFSGGNRESTIGYNYSGGKNINNSNLEINDYFGKALSIDGNRLAVGAYGDDSYNNLKVDTGAVYLYTFSDNLFNGGSLQAILGYSYSGGKNINQYLDGSDCFGYSVSLDGNRLAVGASYDDGLSNWMANTGAVYLYLLDDTTNMNNFYINPSQDYTLSPSTISSLLSTGQNVILQANNDISILNDLFVNNAVGNGGSLTLQAGRSISLNGNITTDNGNLNIIANDTVANGVVNAYRDSGNASVSLEASKTIDAGSGDVLFKIENGSGKTYSDSGNVLISGSVIANTVSLFNNGPSANSNIIINSEASVSASSNGDSIIASSPNGNFINNAGDSAFSTPSGRWTIYSANPADTTEGFSSYDKIYNKTFALNPPNSVPAGNYFLYSIAPTLTITADSLNKTYGSVNPVLTFTTSGLIDGDTTNTALNGLLDTTALQSSPTGNYSIEQGNLAANLGYQINFTAGNLSVNPVTLTIKTNDTIKVKGSSNPPFTVTYSGFVNGDNESNLSVTPQFNTLANNTSETGYYAVNPFGITNNNYNIIFESGTLSIIPNINSTVNTEGSYDIKNNFEDVNNFIIKNLHFEDKKYNLNNFENYNDKPKENLVFLDKK